MTIFVIITGIATLIGLFLQIRKRFPRYRRYYTPPTFMMLGFTIGYIANSITGTVTSLPENITPINILGYALYGGTALLIVGLFLSSIFIQNNDHRSDISRIGSAVSGFLIFLLIFFTSTFFPGPNKNIITFDEQKVLIEHAINRENYDRAITLIHSQKRHLGLNDSRRLYLDGMISEIHSLQITLRVNNPAFSTE